MKANEAHFSGSSRARLLLEDRRKRRAHLRDPRVEASVDEVGREGSEPTHDFLEQRRAIERSAPVDDRFEALLGDRAGRGPLECRSSS